MHRTIQKAFSSFCWFVLLFFIFIANLLSFGDSVPSTNMFYNFGLNSVKRNLVRTCRFVHVEAKIESLGLKMPKPTVPRGNFITFVQIENMVYVAGHLPQPAEGAMIVGKVGKDTTVEDGYEAAKLIGLNICATLKEHLGDLDRVKRVVKLTGFVNCIDEFTQHPAVINGCSDLMVKIFGETGRHARSAVGVNSLPLGVPCEVEAIFEVFPPTK